MQTAQVSCLLEVPDAATTANLFFKTKIGERDKFVSFPNELQQNLF